MILDFKEKYKFIDVVYSSLKKARNLNGNFDKIYKDNNTPIDKNTFLNNESFMEKKV